MNNIIKIYLILCFILLVNVFAQNSPHIKIIIQDEQCTKSAGMGQVYIYEAGTKNLVSVGITDENGVWFALGGALSGKSYDVVAEDQTGQRGEAMNVYFNPFGVQVNICLGAPTR